MILMDFKGEILWLTHIAESGEKYYITSDSHRDMYYLWHDRDGVPTKTWYKADDPTDLYRHCV